jgi:phosphoribosylglycinamide formyltransferase-1
VAAFASGGGTNFQALLDHQRGSALWRVAVLVTNRDAGAVGRARAAGVPTELVRTKDRPDEEVARDTLAVMDRHEIDVILLCGYLRRLPDDVVARYRRRILNIHPALLPDFGGKGMYGMHVHRAVVASGVDVTGATVHFVDEEYDRGPILAQWQVSVLPGDSPEDVAARVLEVEHRLYPIVVDHVCAALAEGRDAEPMKEVRLQEPPPPDQEVR